MEENEKLNEEVKEEKPIEPEQVVLPLEEGNPEDEGYHFPWTMVIIGGVLITLMIACIIVIVSLGGSNA